MQAHLNWIIQKTSPNSNIQIESYPGAHIQHMEAIIQSPKSEANHIFVKKNIIINRSMFSGLTPKIKENNFHCSFLISKTPKLLN